MPRGSKSRSKSKSKVNPRALLYEPPTASPLSPLSSVSLDRDRGEASLNHWEIPYSNARDEPGTKPPVAPFVPKVLSSPLKKGIESRSEKAGTASTWEWAVNTQSTKPLQDQKNQKKHDSSLTFQLVEKSKVKPRGKIQVERSFRVLRSRGYLQLSVEKEPLHESTGSSVAPVIQGKETDEIPFWEASWDKWKDVRGTIRRPI